MSAPSEAMTSAAGAAIRPLRVLLVGYWFPPTNVMGAVRAGKFARYLASAGHDVRILAGPAREPLDLALEVPPASVMRPPAMPAAPPAHRGKLRARLDATGLTTNRIAREVRRHLAAARDIPDKQASWVGPALELGRSMIEDWRPDLIIASAPPYCGLQVAAALHGESRIPWIAELRDPWSGNVYNERPAWRDWVDTRMERRTLRSAAALVVVSPVVATELRARYSQPVAIIPNGYSPDDLVSVPSRGPHRQMIIVYTGTIYLGHRDPTTLFAAIALLEAPYRGGVRVIFYGPAEEPLYRLAAAHGVTDCVEIRPAVSHAESLRLQAEADVLLLLQRDDAADAGNLPAKFFEYISALRPILLLGFHGGVLAGMIRERSAGLVSTSPPAIAEQLRAWIDETRRAGIAALPETARAGLSRAEQFRAYEPLLHWALAGGPSP